MTSKYFDKFPLINYNGQTVVDITKRTALVTSALNNPFLYYQYSVVPGERPDNIADRYYDDQYSDWMIYLTNKTIDPYYGWAMDDTTFTDFITLKYGSVAKAMNKVMFYRSNWYNNLDPITVTTFNTLLPSQQDYFQAVYSDVETSIIPLKYIRKQQDWTISTNAIAGFQVANGNNFIVDEIVNVYFDVNNTGKGQVNFSNSSYVSLQHLYGVVTTGTITSGSYLYGTESNVNTSFTSSSSIANNIPATEVVYWSPVYYYDYETEKNANNKSINLLNNKYSSLMLSELTSLMGQ